MKTDSFALDYLVYKNNNNNNYNQAYGVRISTIDGGTTFAYTTLNPGIFSSYNRSTVAAPVPPSVFLLGTGLIGVVVLGKRVRGIGLFYHLSRQKFQPESPIAGFYMFY